MRIKTGLVLLFAILAAGCTAKTLPSQQPLAVNPVQFSANEWRVPSQAVVIADAAKAPASTAANTGSGCCGFSLDICSSILVLVA